MKRVRLPSPYVARARSMVANWLTLTTDALGNPASPLRRRTLPGAAASARFDVMAATTVVAIRFAATAPSSAEP